MKTGPKPLPPIVRFWRYVRVDHSADACWEWTGGRSPNGYGRFRDWPRRYAPAHRWLYEYLNGPLGALFALHRCDNRLCVRPSHIWAGTKRDNTRDMIAKGRWYSPFVHGDRSVKPETY